MTTKLKELVDALEKASVLKMNVVAHGCGDEGTIDDPEYEMSEFCTNPDLQDLIEEAFDEKGFDYYNGNGGSLVLDIDVENRTCAWSAYAMEEVSCDWASGEETV